MVTEADLSPPAPEQVIEKVLSPTLDIVTWPVPDVAVELVQLFDAAQEVAFVDDHVIVADSPNITSLAEEVIVTVGVGVGVVLSEPPPPPPPPHA